MKFILAPLLLAAIALGYAAVVLGLAWLYHVAGPVGAFVGLLAAFGAALAIGNDPR